MAANSWSKSKVEIFNVTFQGDAVKNFDRVQKSAKIIPHGMISLVTKPKGDHPRWISCTQLK
jgi:hypothetical protein